jgi:hypothetical protein
MFRKGHGQLLMKTGERGLLILCFFMLFAAFSSVAQEEDSDLVTDEQELVQRSDLIVYGSPVGEVSAEPTEQEIPQGQLIVYTQMIAAQKVLYADVEDHAPNIALRRIGVEPLPDAADPINLIYPGPLAVDVDYVLFLERLPEEEVYQVVGTWQGVYPLDLNGRTIALLGEGFGAFQGLTVEQMQEKLEQMEAE